VSCRASRSERLFGRRDALRAGAERDQSLEQCAKVETAAVLRLEPFERFVYVTSVLERYSDLDCSVLLGWAGVT
jgi:hypothetical protein